MINKFNSKNPFNADVLQHFRPLTDDIINSSFQVNSYTEDFSTEKSDASQDPQKFSTNELLDTLFLKIHESDKSDNSIFENILSMIPTNSKSDIYDKQDQINKEIFNKIKKFYQQYNQLIEKNQKNYYYINSHLEEYKSELPFKFLIPEGEPVEFPLRNDFVVSENIQIATNGIELFLLVYHFVFIFKLLIGTELLTNSYKRVDLDPNIKDYNQIICYGQDILVTSSKQNFLIKRKMNGEWEVKSEFFELFKNQLLCSDGIVLVVLNRLVNNKTKFIEYFVYSLNDGSLLFKNFIYYDFEHPEILNIFNAPKFMITNGSILTIINKESTGQLYCHHFNLVKRCFIEYEKRLLLNFQPLCFHHDSVNNSQWILSEKKIDELSTNYVIQRYPSLMPYNPFVFNEMMNMSKKIDMSFFGYYKYNLKIFLPFASKEQQIFYGCDLNYISKLKYGMNLFLFMFSSLFLNPFIISMDQKEIKKFMLKFMLSDEKEQSDGYQLYIQQSFTTFIKCFFCNPFNNSSLFSLWILRMYQFSWYSKIRSQKILDLYHLIFSLDVKNITISSLFLNIFSINSIAGAMVDIDDISSQEKESALFIYFLQMIAYEDTCKIKDTDILKNHLEVVFDLLPLISYRKRMVVTYFSFLDRYGYSNLRSFYVYSLFVSMAISCLLVSKNDVKWSYNSELDRSLVNTNQIECENVMNCMKTIYARWKPLVNKNINEKVKLFDSKCLYVFYKLISGQSIDLILPDIESNIKTNKNLQMSLDLMYSYRNKYRKSMQEKNDKWIEQIDILLLIMNNLKCNFDENDDKKALINEFMQHDYHIAYNFLYSDAKKKELIQQGMTQLLNVLKHLSNKDFAHQVQQYSTDIFMINELFIILFDLLTRFSKINNIEDKNDIESIENNNDEDSSENTENSIKIIDTVKTINEQPKEISEKPKKTEKKKGIKTPKQITEDIIKKILKIENFECINKFSALYIIRSLESCHDKKLNKTTLKRLAKHFNIQEGVFINKIPDENTYIIYNILILYLASSIKIEKLVFLHENIDKFNRYQWILLIRIIKLNGLEGKTDIYNHLIENITDIDIFSRLGKYRSFSLEILNNLNQIPKEKVDSFIKKIFERIGEEVELFYEDEDGTLLSSYFINEANKNKENFIFKNQIYDLISSDEFNDERNLCCSFKLISSIDELQTKSEFSNKMINYFKYALNHKHLSSGFLAMNIVNKFLPNEDFWNKLIEEFDIDQIIYKIKSCSNQSSIINQIRKLHSLDVENLENESIFDIIKTEKGSYFISPVIKKSCIGKIQLIKEIENISVQIFICEESQNSKLFNVITHSKENFLENQTEAILIINAIQKQISISNSNSIVYNNATNPVRLVIFSDNADKIKLIVKNKNVFCEKTKNFVDRQSYGTFNISKKKSFIDKSKFDKSIENGGDILQNKLNEKLCFQFLYEKRKTLFSINDIKSISLNLKENIIHSYKKYLTESTFFITAVKMVSLHNELLNYNHDFMLQLFILLILNYDTFSIVSFEKEEFPFQLENIIFKSNFVSNYNFDDLSRYTIQSVLNAIIEIPSFHSIFYYHIKNLYREYHSHFPRKSKIIEFDKEYTKAGFIFIPQFCENYKNTVKFKNNSTYKLTYFTKSPSFSVQQSNTQFLFYSINPNKRNWIFNSPFEFLILLKYFIYLSSSKKERELAKSCLFEAFFINSPIISFYSMEFLKFIFLHLPYESDNSSESSISYQKSLFYYQQNSQSFNMFYQLFLSIEIMLKADPCISEFSRILPEYSKNSKVDDQKPLNFSIDFFSIYTNIEVENKPGVTDLIYSYKLFNLINFFNIKSTSEFPYFNFFKFWATVKYEEMISLKQDVKSIELGEMKKMFSNDVNDFILMWNKEFTNEILNKYIDFDFTAPKVPFYIISKTADKLSSLHSKFQMSLIMTVILILGEINRAFQFCDLESTSKLNPDFSEYLIPKSSIQLIRSSIAINRDTSNIPRFFIDRKSFYLNPNKCTPIIEQFARQVIKINMSHLQCQKPPFRVTFVNEEAIDASGPMRELMAELANSIFQKRSNLTIVTPSDLALFIPFTNDFPRYKDVYYSIGVFIGIVIRTNIPQSIPFAPLVWNYLSNETISEKDIVSVDTNLGQMFKNVRNSVENHCEVHFPWKATNWNSTEYIIKGKIGKYVNENEVEEFISSVVRDRIDSIRDPLVEMRKGFIDNLGFKSKMPFGSLFSKMAQSVASFTAEDLMAITRYSSCSFESKSVSVFWAAVKRLTMDQLSLLLKFITTQTRIPTDESSNFTIDIVEKQPSDNMKSDEMLLGASTCFNRLYLPCYSNPDIAYQKIVTSIEFCQTMELS